MSESTPRRKLVAILAADVVGFSKKMGENEDRTLRNLCLLYTSDAADDSLRVDLGGRRIIKKPRTSRV